jgi:hypothetical protein
MKTVDPGVVTARETKLAWNLIETIGRCDENSVEGVMVQIVENALASYRGQLQEEFDDTQRSYLERIQELEKQLAETRR